MKRKPQHTHDGKTDPQSQARAALLREIDASTLSPDDKRLLKMVAVQPTSDAIASGRAALAAAIQRAERSAR